MKITKFGHCCLLIEEGGARILTDPGTYSAGQNNLTNIDVILITHEHADHIDLSSIKILISKNPQAVIMTNTGCSALLKKERIKYKLLEHGESVEINGVLIEGFGEKHAIMYPTLTPANNTGYFIGNRFFYPGDALYNPGKKVEILGLPVAGPWLKLSEAIDYTKEINPKICFPVHEGILKTPGSVHVIPPSILGPLGIEFKILKEGESAEF